MSRKIDTTPGSRWNYQQTQAFNIEHATIKTADIPPTISSYFKRVTLNPEVQNILGKINAHQIRAGSEQELREAAENTWLYPFLFFLSNSSEEYYYLPSQDTPRYEQRERITVQQEEFVTGEGLSSSPAPDSQMSQELSSSMSQDSYILSEGVSESNHLSRITSEPATTLTAVLFLQAVSESRQQSKTKNLHLKWHATQTPFRIVNKNFDCTTINDGTLVRKQKVGGVWVHNPNNLVYCSLETKRSLEDWNDGTGERGQKVHAQEGAELLGMMAQRVARIPVELLSELSHYDRTYVRLLLHLKMRVLTDLSSAILISGAQTYLSIKFATFEIPYIIQHLASGAEGAPFTPEPSLPGWKNMKRLDPGLLIQNTPQMNLLDPKERLKAAEMVAGIMDYLESEGPLLKNLPGRDALNSGN